MRKTIYFLLLNTTILPVHSEVFTHLEQALPTKVNIKGQEPMFDFDNDSCYPSTGISKYGQQNRGLNVTGGITTGCRAKDFLGSSNTLHRYACIDSQGNSYCGHFYSLYFEKDQVAAFSDLFGHRHDWEHVAIWTKNGVITHASYSAHGKLITKPITLTAREGDHVKFVYHKDGLGTHAFRFARQSETAENDYGYWVTPIITTWSQMKGNGISNSSMRQLLNDFDYGKATIPMKYVNFMTNLNKGKPYGYPLFTKYSIEMAD